MAPTQSDRERRARLLRLTDGVRAFFEQTSLHARGESSWRSAFRAVQKNERLAAEFVEELRLLIAHIDQAYAAAPTGGGPGLHEEQTRLLKLPEAAPRKSAPTRRTPPPVPPPLPPAPFHSSLESSEMDEPTERVRLPPAPPPITPPRRRR